ncbi:MAG: hypothetical protein E6G22_07390 [Actinobacteria bacterium]|nr:MAG: hypothetical protein E6G22_07390 [Actinomycetota bacterium]
MLRVHRHRAEEDDVGSESRDRGAHHPVRRDQEHVQDDVHRRAQTGDDPVELRAAGAADPDRDHRVARVCSAGEAERRDRFRRAVEAGLARQELDEPR